MSKCYKQGISCGPYEHYSCSECPASKPSYLEKDDEDRMKKCVDDACSHHYSCSECPSGKDSKIISASEARKLMNSRPKDADEILEKIHKIILRDLKQGYTYYPGFLHIWIKGELIRLGYELSEHEDQFEGRETRISW